eukprot:scaffold4396_cov127-Skeletonema_dohrnii-CCMP3373.AAC.2
MDPLLFNANALQFCRYILHATRVGTQDARSLFFMWNLWEANSVRLPAAGKKEKELPIGGN